MNAKIDAKFWDQIAPEYAEKPVPDEAAYQTTLERIRAHLTPTDRVLEIGCGTGTTAVTLAPSVAEIVATDVSQVMLEFGRQRAETGGVTNVSFEQASLESHQFKAGTFDVVLGFNVLHLLGNVPAGITSIERLLKPGGLFMSKTPCIGDMNLLVRGMLPVLRVFGKAPWVTHLTKADLQGLTFCAGFRELETGYYPEKSDSFFLVVRKPGLRSSD